MVSNEKEIGNILGESQSGTATHIENYKLVILGDQFVGKTSILNKYKYETIEDKYAPTIGIDFITKNVFLEDKTVRLIMWDTAGSERFTTLIPSYLKNTQAIILTYDLTNRKSFMSLTRWLEAINDTIKESVFIIIAANKLDNEKERQVPFEEGKAFAEKKGLAFIEVSANTGANIKKLFEHITSSIYESNQIATVKDKTIVLDQMNNNTEKTKKKCCQR